MRRGRTEARQRKITYLPLDQATAEPGDGVWEVWVDCWWSYEKPKGLLFFSKTPQCNRNESIARTVNQHHPGAEIIFVPRVYVRHNCGDYV